MGNTELVDERQKIIEKKINELNKGAFELAGAYPYIFDVLCYVCTHAQAAIERKENKNETHYRVRIPIDKFYEIALDGKHEQGHELLKELHELHQKPKTMSFPLTAELSISTKPIRIDLVYESGRKTTGKEIKYIVIEFYKLLFYKYFEKYNNIQQILSQKI